MHYRVVLKILGVLCFLFGLTMLPPIAVSLIYGDGEVSSFATALAVISAIGLGLWTPNRNVDKDLRYRDGFVVVVMFWTVLGLVGAIPIFLVMKEYGLGWIDAVFESISGLTTTGATVLTGLDQLPKSLLYYRQQLQWLGGMGIIVLAVAVMPMLGVGGMQLYRAETPGPMKDTKLTPRITETAKALWLLYLALTLVCALAYWIAGMDWFDALGHSFSTVAIGGFSTHDQSLGYFDNPMVDLVAIVFMLIAGINFALHFTFWKTRRAGTYVMDNEVTVFLSISALASVIAIGVLLGLGAFETPMESIRQGMLQVVSIATTTGYTTGGYHWWPSFLPVLLIALSFVGGCAGSTAGGIKVIRILLLYKQGRREFLKLVHPNAMTSIKINGKPVPDSVVNAVWAFFSLYILSFVSLGLIMSATGLDWITAFSAVAACLNNLGPGLEGVADNYTSVGDVGKLVLCFVMLLGRLELMTLMVLFSFAYWRS